MRVVFLGTPEFAVGPLKSLIEATEVVAVYSQPDKPVGRGLKMQASPVKQVALAHHIPVFTPEKISVPDEVERLKAQTRNRKYSFVAFAALARGRADSMVNFGWGFRNGGQHDDDCAQTRCRRYFASRKNSDFERRYR
jgi:hypothetical protein